MFLSPDHLLPDVLHLEDAFLEQKGIEGIIFDIDNTLVSYRTPEPTEAVLSLLDHLREKGIQMAIASNNKKCRVERFAENLGLTAYHRSAKPLPFVLRRISRDFGLPPKRIALVGDQIFTDIWGGNWAGMQSILVEPIDPLDEGLFFRIKRRLERPIIARRRAKEEKK